MAKHPRKPRESLHEKYREASGWYLAAWRDHRGLTLEDLAAAVGTSKGVVSDLETGARRPSGVLSQRFNRDDVEGFSRALGVTGGALIDINPFTAALGALELAAKIAALQDADREAVERLLRRLFRQ